MKNFVKGIMTLGIISAVAVVGFTGCCKADKALKASKTKTIEKTVCIDQPLGGWTDDDDMELTEERLEIFNKATEGLLGVNYEPVAYLGSQVVAGLNHCYLCRITAVYPGAEPELSLVYIYEDLEGNCVIRDVIKTEI